MKIMDSLIYHIVIKTPMGYRVGDISLNIDVDRICGTIEAPCFEPSFTGILHDDSTMSLTFSVTYENMQAECAATGRISTYAIHISVPSGDFTYEIDGTAKRT